MNMWDASLRTAEMYQTTSVCIDFELIILFS